MSLSYCMTFVKTYSTFFPTALPLIEASTVMSQSNRDSDHGFNLLKIDLCLEWCSCRFQFYSFFTMLMMCKRFTAASESIKSNRSAFVPWNMKVTILLFCFYIVEHYVHCSLLTLLSADAVLDVLSTEIWTWHHKHLCWVVRWPQQYYVW